MSNDCESIATTNLKLRSSRRYSGQDIHMVDGDAFAVKGTEVKVTKEVPESPSAQ